MPPKRKSDGAAASTTKKGKKASPVPDEDLSLSRHPRWAKVSASGNSDAAYRELLRDPEYAYAWLTACKQLLENGTLEGEDDEDDEDEEGKNDPHCDGGATCPCMDPVAEHPEAKYCISRAGMQRFNMVREMFQYRDPDTFGMYTFNDASAYGLLEVMENQILDFEEAHKNWKAQWAVCEAVAMYIGADEFPALGHVDDPDTREKFLGLLGKMFLTMLDKLASMDLLNTDSEVKDLAVVMTMFVQNSQKLGQYGLYFPEDFPINVLAYALKHDIVLSELLEVDKFVKDHSEEAAGVSLPALDSNRNDPWKFADALKQYRSSKRPNKMGGDAYDITTWTSAKRKANAFDKRNDPCPKHMIDALKKGMFIGLG
ncbi:hypothetical protein N7532_001066 [Penicillium argentinense]|uniref:Uncharacterized protein n=1 Tax=Penicillium argentinense TaxID=1131581 RepID=A0A9W9G1T0_9EURO|nr:uncharacterized protein N7532_001066 [Penicillium argentinense]KAJ5110531.1 hypothetical protein N7532_001066 [Penicillium argentinense]